MSFFINSVQQRNIVTMKTSKYGDYFELESSDDEVEERRADGLLEFLVSHVSNKRLSSSTVSLDLG